MSQPATRQRLQKIPVFFCDAMQAQVTGISPSAHKPLAAVGSWTVLGIPLAIIEPTPATREDFTRAHDPEFVDAILECRAMNGFGTRAADVAASLPYERYNAVGAKGSAPQRPIGRRTHLGIPSPRAFDGRRILHLQRNDGYCFGVEG